MVISILCPKCHCSTVTPVKGHEDRHGQVGLLVRYECKGCRLIFDLQIVNTAETKPLETA